MEGGTERWFLLPLSCFFNAFWRQEGARRSPGEAWRRLGWAWGRACRRLLRVLGPIWGAPRGAGEPNSDFCYPSHVFGVSQGGGTPAGVRTTPRDLAPERGRGEVNLSQRLGDWLIRHLPLHALRPEASADYDDGFAMLFMITCADDDDANDSDFQV